MLKTILPDFVRSAEQAEAFLTSLHDSGECFHPDDDAHSVVWGQPGPTRKERDKLNKLMGQCRKYVDPCGVLLALAKRDGMLGEEDEGGEEVEEVVTPINQLDQAAILHAAIEQHKPRTRLALFHLCGLYTSDWQWVVIKPHVWGGYVQGVKVSLCEYTQAGKVKQTKVGPRGWSYAIHS